jgi:hypothetical protein
VGFIAFFVFMTASNFFLAVRRVCCAIPLFMDMLLLTNLEFAGARFWRKWLVATCNKPGGLLYQFFLLIFPT